MREKRIERDSERERMSFKRKKGERRVEDSERQRENERKKRENPEKKTQNLKTKQKNRTRKRKKSQENPRKPKERGERNPNTHTNTDPPERKPPPGRTKAGNQHGGRSCPFSIGCRLSHFTPISRVP